MQLEEIRREYKQAELNENTIAKSPFEQFRKWMNEAMSADIRDATAMSLVSISTDGFPQTRIVLLKDYGPAGFTFFTNYNSEKGKNIAANRKVSLHFFWSDLERQIRISGLASKTNKDISNKYFYSRPLESQVAAVISEQSSVISSRKLLDTSFDKLLAELNGANPNCPENWGGYIVEPLKFEFWQGRESRLHDRIVYEKEKQIWITKRLAP